MEKNTGMRPPGIGWRTKICPVWEKLNHCMVNKQRWPRGSQLTCHVGGMNETNTLFPETGSNVHKERNVSHFVPSVIKSLAWVVISLQLYSRGASAFVLSVFSSAWEDFIIPWGKRRGKEICLVLFKLLKNICFIFLFLQTTADCYSSPLKEPLAVPALSSPVWKKCLSTGIPES